MKINDYRTEDGDLWGAFAEGHVDKAEFLIAVNEAVFDEEPQSIEKVEHLYIANRPTHEDDNFATYWAEKSDEDARPVTAIKQLD